MLKEFLSKTVQMLPGLCGKLIGAVIVLFVGFKVAKLITKAFRNSKGASKLDEATVLFLANLICMSLKTFIVITVIAILGIPTSSIIALLGSAGLAVGLALQGSLSNFAGGVMLLIFKPFGIDDYVETNDAAGTVVNIGIFYTTLLTPDNKRIVVPNSALSNKTITNCSVKETRRVDFSLRTKYDCDIDKVKEIILAAASAHELVLKDPEPFARLSEQKDNALEFACRVWVKSEDYWTVHFDLTEQFRKAFNENGIAVPYTNIEIKNG